MCVSKTVKQLVFGSLLGYTSDKKQEVRKEGQKEVFENHKIKAGVVSLGDAYAHWYILDSDRSGHGRHSVVGQTAVLFENEIFDKGVGSGNKAVHFGVVWGKENVVIYIEPKGKGYVQNISRSNLRQSNGLPLPWQKWQDEFIKNFPKELQEYMEKTIKKSLKD